jgi:hypothetical protein
VIPRLHASSRASKLLTGNHEFGQWPVIGLIFPFGIPCFSIVQRHLVPSQTGRRLGLLFQQRQAIAKSDLLIALDDPERRAGPSGPPWISSK